ncbi:hypothetical protein K1T71_000965 [Dendrolimus kikuchii]|uniref:Uncharacterized protein n=1 Tax=Dendrolimus kikuchii TaxID=765133 RepID=A0ACC1DG79_9NEOP|nr:hypothetical protein K1T71_000965 [Dendrolimus kikuchii]
MKANPRRKMSDIMTHTLFNLYNAPEGFCFDFLCNDEPIIDDPDNKVYNADKRVNDFIAQLERQAKYYDHDNLMVTMGGDFTYQSAANWFMNIDKLINHVNTHPANISDINIFYSTPSCYMKAIYLYGRRDKAIYTEKVDHLPYGSDSSTYWTGYYTSRPSLKYLVKRAHIFLQIVKQLTVLARMGDSYELHLLRHAVSLVLHHDAITGTSQQHVTNDFIRILSEAIDSCSKKVSHLLSLLTPTWGASRRSKNGQQFVICHQLNISQCRFTETQESMLLIVYNPLSVKTYNYVRLPAIALHYSIRDYNDEEIQYQLVPLPASIINLPGRSSTAIQELCFEAENIPPLGYTAFYITPVRDQLEENEYAKKISQDHGDDHELVPFISNEYIKVTVDKTTGFLESIQHVDGVKIDLSQNFYYYSQGQQTLQSGAYSFRPVNQRPTPITEKATYNTIRGPLIKEIRQRFSDWVTQVIRLYRGEEFVEMEWVIGPVPIGADLGKEVVTILKTNVTNNGEFFTDSNARQMLKRTCWNETSSQQQKKPISACYYPVTSRICIHSLNSSVGMCILTDRPQGGASYGEGEIELMLHRRLLTDDGFGLEESLNEEAYGVGLVVKGKHRLLFGNHRQEVEELTFSERISLAARQWTMKPWLFFSSGDKITRRKWQNVRNKRFSAIKLHGLPRHIHILTLEPWKGGSVLLRLENTLEAPVRGRFKSQNSEDYISKPSHITVELRKIFLQNKIKMVRETTLAANQWLDDARQMDWSTRYVYSGSDDGILPEDNLYDNADDNKQPRLTEAKDSVINKDHFYRRLINDTNTSAFYNDIIERIKGRRALLNDDDNTIVKYTHDIHNDNIIEFINLRKKRSLLNNVKLMKFNNTCKSYMYSTNNDTNINEVNGHLNNMNNQNKCKLNSTSKRLKRELQAIKNYTDLVNNTLFKENLNNYINESITNVTIDFTVINNFEKTTNIIYDDSDDGITKSIYDMYYKVKPKSNPFKPLLRDSKDDVRDRSQRKKKRNNDYYDDEISTKRYQQQPIYVVKRKVDEKDVEYEDQDKDGRYEKNSENSRRKRTLPKEDEPPTEPSSDQEQSDTTDPDYVVTLRPTQIRTFVIWFENNKKTYVI